MTAPIESGRLYVVHRHEQQGRALARELERLNRTDANGRGVAVPFLEYVQRRAAWSEQTRCWLREERCPSCEWTPDGARRCSSFGDATPFHGVPMCKWASGGAIERYERDLTADRLHRLIVAGCRDPEVRRVVPPARVGRPPLPELSGVAEEEREQLLAGPRKAMRGAELFLGDEQLLTLVLQGGAGVGKSFAAAHCVASTEQQSCWLQASQWDSFARIREAGERAEECDLLVVDDLGIEEEGAAGRGSAALCGLLWRRNAAGRRTVVTTVLTSSRLAQRDVSGRLEQLNQNGLIVECGQRSVRAVVGAGK